MVKLDINDQQKISDIQQAYTTLKGTFTPIFNEMNTNYNMLASKNQWDSDLKAELEAAGRPVNAYNLLSGVVKHFSSLESGNRKSLQALGRTPDDVDMALTITKLLDTLNYNQNFNYHRTRAFIDAIIARWGWLRTAWSFEDDPLGMLAIDAINPMELMFEMGYSDITLKRSRFVLYTPDMTLDQIAHQYCQNNNELLMQVVNRGHKYFSDGPTQEKKFISTALRALITTAAQFVTGGFSDEYNQNIRKEDWFDVTTGKFKILELHERRTERRMMAYDPVNNKQVDITDSVLSKDNYTEDTELVQKAMGQYPEASQPTWKLVKQIWISTVIPALNLKVYDAPYAVQNGNFMFTPVFCYDFHADMTQTQSVIDELLDPQTDYNKRRSTMLEMLVRFSSIGYLVEEGAIDGFESDYTTKEIGKYKRVKKGMLNSVKPEEYPTIPSDLFRDAEESKMLIEYISGATKAVRGIGEGSNEPAKLFIAKKDVSIQMVQHLYDNLDQAVLQVGQNEVANIQKFLTMPRIFRIVNPAPGEEGFLSINEPEVAIENGKVIQRIKNDITIGKYDVAISETPYGTTAREMEFLKLVDLMKFAIEVDPQSAIKMLPVVIQASDTPYRNEFLKALGTMDQQKQDKEAQAQTAMLALQQAFQQLQLDKGKTEVQGKQIDNQEKQVQTQGVALDNTKKQLEIQQILKGQRMMDALGNIAQNYTRA